MERPEFYADPPCVPWPPRPWPPQPPEEPETDAGIFGLPVDWSAYSHQELHTMVHDEVDLAGADRVAQTWSDLGSSLDRIAEDLRRAVQSSSAGWSGEAAEQAREAATGLVHWSEGTAGRGHGVAGLVGDQAGYVRVARDSMPAPILPAVPERPELSAFGGGGFARGGELVADNGAQQEIVANRHQQAAEVMRQLQHDSGEVYGRVPHFPPPRVEYEAPERPLPPQPRPDVGDDGTTASGVDSAPAGAAAGSGRPQTLAPGGMAGAGMPPSAGDQLAGGGRVGAGAVGGPAAATAASGPVAGGGPRGPLAAGGMPMGAAGSGARPGDDTEHKSPAYLEEDEDLWGADVPVVAPVIGEDSHRRGF
ncbi:PPE family protein [Amycolatopsis marina]|uniref:PPE family protein n=1 Tax=Amycolatopsis marina TaxID=490629 RepID=A0A1I0XJG7_9PSEU|nr:PPE domain-containing protein [Amycolatopsis marina]SFB01054.1 PPE family protein [Amycolatopsis marina]